MIEPTALGKGPPTVEEGGGRVGARDGLAAGRRLEAVQVGVLVRLRAIWQKRATLEGGGTIFVTQYLGTRRPGDTAWGFGSCKSLTMESYRKTFSTHAPTCDWQKRATF